MTGKHDIQTQEDIKILVDNFYEKVREDTLLSAVFFERIKDNWPQHLDKMYRFWQTVLLEEHTYYGSPFGPHATLHIEKKHFDKWLQLFCATVDEYFEGTKATETKWRADKMAEMFLSKIEYYKSNFAKPLI